MKKPTPIHTETICSVCGLDWDRHTKKTAEECIELLKSDLAREKQRTTPPQPYIPFPWRPVYPQPRPVYPYWPPTWQSPSTIPQTVTWSSGNASWSDSAQARGPRGEIIQ